MCIRDRGWGMSGAPFVTMVNAMGGKFYDMDWNATVDTPEQREAWEMYKNVLRDAGQDDIITYTSVSYTHLIFGAKKVVVFDISDERLDLALRLGADEVINTTKESYMEQALAITKGKGYAYVFETAGQVPTMHMAFELAANKAHVCFIGTPHVDLTFTPAMWENMNRKEFKPVSYTHLPSRVDVTDNCFMAPGNMIEEIKDYCRRTGQKVPETLGEIATCVYASLARCV